MTDIYKYVFKTLSFSPVIADRKEWVLTAAALAGSALSSIVGGTQSAKAAKKAKQEQAYRTNAEKAWYDKQYNTDYLDTKAGQNLMRRAQEVQDDYVKKAEGSAAVGGSTSSSVAQAKEAANRTMGSTIANIAASDTSRKQSVADSHLQHQLGQSKEREATENNRAANIATASQNMSNALMTAAGSLEGGGNSINANKLASSGSPSDNTLITQNAKEVAQAHLTSNRSLLDKATGVANDYYNKHPYPTS